MSCVCEARKPNSFSIGRITKQLPKDVNRKIASAYLNTILK